MTPAPSPSTPPAEATESAFLRPRVQAVLVVAAALAVYAPALAARLVYDDYPLVEANPWIRSPAWLGDIFRGPLFGFIPSQAAEDTYYRPLMHVVLMAVHAVAGTAAWAYHLVPILVHATASLTVWALARRLLQGLPSGAALGAGLLFAVHPVHVETVAWVSALMDLSTTAAGLGMLWLLAVRPLAPGRALAGAALWLVALLFKEVAVTVPLMLLAWDVADGAPLAGRWRERAWRYLPLAGAAALYLVLRLNAVGLKTISAGWQQLPAGVALLNTLPLLAGYARLLLLPTDLSIYHPFEPALSLADGRVLAGAAVALAVAAGLVLLRRRAPAAWLGLAWAVLPLLPALHLRALGESPVAERYAYLPSVGFCLLAAAAWGAWARRAALARIPVLVGVAVLVTFTVRAGTQVGVWQDDVSLWLNTVETYPDTPTPLYMLGSALRREGAAEEAVGPLERSVVLRPSFAPAVAELADSLLQAGQPARARELLEAALRDRPDQPGFHYRLGRVLRALGEGEAAVRSFRESLRLNPASPEAWVALGEAQVGLGRPKEALASLEEARTRAPDSVSVHRALAQAYRALGDEARAREHEAAASRAPQVPGSGWSPHSPEAEGNSR